MASFGQGTIPAAPDALDTASIILSLQGLAKGMLVWWLTHEVGVYGDFAS